MKIVTTPMCKGILDIIGVDEYIVARILTLRILTLP